MIDKRSPAFQRGLSFVLSNLRSARARLAFLQTLDGPKNSDEIWETYCDVETAVAMSRFIFGSFGRASEKPKGTTSRDWNPATTASEIIRAKFQSIDSTLAEAENKLQSSSSDGIELLKIARDELKLILLSAEKSKEKKSAYYPKRSKIPRNSGG